MDEDAFFCAGSERLSVFNLNLARCHSNGSVVQINASYGVLLGLINLKVSLMCNGAGPREHRQPLKVLVWLTQTHNPSGELPTISLFSTLFGYRSVICTFESRLIEL